MKIDGGNADKGDLLEVKLNGSVVHGELIDASEGKLILKLKSGYDIVIRKEDASDIKIVQKAEKFTTNMNATTIDNKIDGADIGIITTGGTIGSKVDYKTGGVSPTFTAEDVVNLSPEIKKYGRLYIKNLMNIFSENMTPDDWISIAKEVMTEVKRGIKGVVITMGTDTMHYAAAALSFMLNPLSIPVVITGAQRSGDRGSTDGSSNLLASVIAARKWAGGEVTICMHANMNDEYNFILRGNKARKMHTERRDAFRPINIKPLGRVYLDGRIEEIGEYRGKASETKLDTRIDDKVGILLSYPSFDGKIIDYMIDSGLHGLVIAATGFGNLPIANKSVIKALKHANDKNVPIVVTSQTIYGRTNKFVYKTSREMSEYKNVMYVEDMTTEAAFAKLMFVLGHKRRMEEISNLMTTPLAGEISERSKIDEFLI
ncbi:MAG: Glu-tRNA(Gln) amidotransferase subunit GatD [Candidatus Parvarchaeota archaeon]